MDEVFDFNLLVGLCRETHQTMRLRAARSINIELVVRNWLLGWYLVEYKSAFGSDVNLSNDAMLFNFVSGQCNRKQQFSSKEAADLNEIFDVYLRKKRAHVIEV